MIGDTDNRHRISAAFVVLLFLAVLGALWFFLIHETARDLAPLRVYVEAARDLAKGQAITSDDLNVVLKRYDRNEPISRPRQAIGMAVRKDVKQGQPLLPGDLYRPPPKDDIKPKQQPQGDPGNAGMANGQESKTKAEGHAPEQQEANQIETIVNRVTELLLAELKALEQRLMEQQGKSAEQPIPGLLASGEALEEVIGLLELQRRLASGGQGGASVLDIIDSVLGVGKEVFEKTEPVEIFLVKFLGSFGEKFGEAAGQTLNELGKLVYRQLTRQMPGGENGVPPPRPGGFSETMTLRYATVGAAEGQEVENELKSIIERLKAATSQADCSLLVSGHTDTLGSDATNYALSRQRAQNVTDRLKQDLPNLPIDKKGRGERRLAILTSDGIAEMANRRVEITLRCNDSRN